MTSPQPSVPQSPSIKEPAPDELARLESGKRAVNIMLLVMGVGVIGVIAYGLYRMTSVILANL